MLATVAPTFCSATQGTTGWWAEPATTPCGVVRAATSSKRVGATTCSTAAPEDVSPPDTDACDGGGGSDSFSGCETTGASPAGSVDRSFDGDGTRIDDVALDPTVTSVALQDDGRIVVVGTACGGDILVARYTSAGKPDETFADSGRRCIDVGTGSPDRGQSIVVLDDVFTVVRTGPDGTDDPTFGADGMTVVPFGSGTDATVAAAVVQPDGKVLVGGSVGPDAGGLATSSSSG